MIILADEKQTTYFDEIIRKSIDRDVGFICSIGEQHDLIHEMADEEIVFRNVDIEEHYLPTHCIMTIGSNDFEDGLWSGLNITYNDKDTINDIVIVDVTRKAYSKTIELIRKFETGYLPPD